MHSRIFQVGTTEIDPSDYIRPDVVSDLLCDNGVADYVDDVEDRAEELKYLMGSVSYTHLTLPTKRIV